jgi:hypothetical protein
MEPKRENKNNNVKKQSNVKFEAVDLGMSND